MPAEHERCKLIADTVTLHMQVGTPVKQIASVVNLDVKTLKKHYAYEIENAKAIRIQEVGGVLLNLCMRGNLNAIQFYLKSQAGWSETERVDHTSSDGSMTPAPVAQITRRIVKANDK